MTDPWNDIVPVVKRKRNWTEQDVVACVNPIPEMKVEPPKKRDCLPMTQEQIVMNEPKPPIPVHRPAVLMSGMEKRLCERIDEVEKKIQGKPVIAAKGDGFDRLTDFLDSFEQRIDKLLVHLFSMKDKKEIAIHIEKCMSSYKITVRLDDRVGLR